MWQVLKIVKENPIYRQYWYLKEGYRTNNINSNARKLPWNKEEDMKLYVETAHYWHRITKRSYIPVK